MDWYIFLIAIIGALITFMAMGVPVAFSFLAVNIIGIIYFWGWEGLSQLVLSMYSSVASFSLLPVPLFILMGEIMFHSGVALKMMDTLDKWIGRIPGRLSLLAVGGGTIFATLSGSSIASTAMLGSILLPEMKKRDYGQIISIGPILGSGTLASMIPPTALGVLLASLSGISIGKFLLAIVIPGVLMALSYVIYITFTCSLKPELAPPYEVNGVSFKEKFVDTIKYVLPLGIIIFLVIGVIVMGIATPNEAAALGALGSFILAIIYSGPNMEMMKKTMSGTVTITGMMFIILAGSTAFSQLLAFSGATEALVQTAMNIDIAPLGLLIIMQMILILMGMFMEPLSILMITLPLFIPIAQSLDFNLFWFCAIILLNMEIAAISPPFGMSLFVMKGLLPPETSMGLVYRAGIPFLVCDIIIMVLMIAFPQTVLWLPSIAQ